MLRRQIHLLHDLATAARDNNFATLGWVFDIAGDTLDGDPLRLWRYVRKCQKEDEAREARGAIQAAWSMRVFE